MSDATVVAFQRDESGDVRRRPSLPRVQVCRSSTRSWIVEAADLLRTRGACALLGDERGAVPPPIPRDVCADAAAASASRLAEMHRRIRNRGVDPTGVEAPYRFAEVVCRDERGGRRYDVPVPWLSAAAAAAADGELNPAGFAPLGTDELRAIGRLHDCLDELVRPVVEALWSGDDAGDGNGSGEGSGNGASSQVVTSGFLINEPGSEAQDWHRDGPDGGYINAFVPLVDLTESLGPTALLPGTHLGGQRGFDDSHAVVPLLQMGEVLLFDYRTLHRGQGNTSSSMTRALGYAVYTRTQGASSCGDVHNFPAAVTLEYD